MAERAVPEWARLDPLCLTPEQWDEVLFLQAAGWTQRQAEIHVLQQAVGVEAAAWHRKRLEVIDRVCAGVEGARAELAAHLRPAAGSGIGRVVEVRDA